MQLWLNSDGNKGVLAESKESRATLASSNPQDIRNNVSPPETAVEAKQKWHSPRINMWRVFACYFSFLIFGMNDGAYGVCRPVYSSALSILIKQTATASSGTTSFPLISTH
jgi:hypothetical protein